MSRIRPCNSKGYDALAREWDRLAEERHRQITSGEDLSFEHVVIPTMWSLFDGADRSVVLEIGCGTGDFTVQLAQVAQKVIAIDPSRISIALARQVCRSVPNVRFIENFLEEAELGADQEKVTAAVAVMTLMTAPDLKGIANTLCTLLPSKAYFVAVITHPWFWPKYWEYEEEPWFRYELETFIEAPFSISKRRTNFITTHIHRPLEQYLRTFALEGFQLDALVEPIPPVEIQSIYPAPWRFPRFLGLKWKKFP